jgi:hypothetical protein
MIGRLALPAAAGAVQLAAALLVLGRPDLDLTRGFLLGSLPTVSETLAALQLLAWALVALSVGWGLIRVLTAGAAVARAARSRYWEISVAGVGLLLLAFGVAHQTSYQVTLAGGSVQEAQQALGR